MTNHVSEILAAITVGAIWGLSLTQVDTITKIICTVAVSTVTIVYTIKKYNDRKK